MLQFEYRTRREMEPRPGRRYATVYLVQTPQQRSEMARSIGRCIEQLAAAVPDNDVTLDRPQRDFRREDGTHYSATDILVDLWGQLRAGRDPTEAMIGRWNRLFEATEWQIEMRKSNG